MRCSELVQPDPVLEREVTDLRGGDAEQDERAPRVLADGRAGRGREQGQLVRLRGPHPDRLLGVGRDEFRGRAVRDELAAADDEQVVGRVFHLRHQVAGDEDRTPLGGERLHQVPDPHDALGVEPVDWLVEHEDLRIAEQRAGDAEPLAHAKREALGALAGHVAEADQVEHLPDPPLGQVVGLRHAEQVVVGAATAVHRLRIEQRTDLAHRPGVPAERLAVDRHGAAGGTVQAKDEAHGRGLARTVRAEEPGDLAWLDREGQVVDGERLAVSLREASCLNHVGVLSSAQISLAGPSRRGIALRSDLQVRPQGDAGTAQASRRTNTTSPAVIAAAA